MTIFFNFYLNKCFAAKGICCLTLSILENFRLKIDDFLSGFKLLSEGPVLEVSQETGVKGKMLVRMHVKTSLNKAYI